MSDTPVAFNLVPTLILLTHGPHHPATADGLVFARQFVSTWQTTADTAIPLKIFLYSDAVMLANRLIWLPADLPNYAQQWQQLAVAYQLPIQVCVSAALARGVTDDENAKRHGLTSENLAEGFNLVGLGELAMHLHTTQQVRQF